MSQLSLDSLPRRDFLKKIGGATFVISAGVALPASMITSKENGSRELSVWVHLEQSGRVIILNPAAEMGQGSLTALAVIIAEEMEVDWKDVHIEDSPIEPDTYGLQWGGKLGGPMITVGSRTVRGYYHALRLAGAQVKKLLLATVAEKWQTPVSELKAAESMVYHRPTNKKMSYGEIAYFIQVPDKLPEVDDSDLKDPRTFTLIGKKIDRFDIPAKTDGSAQYSIDVTLPGMLYGVISRSPVNGASPTLRNEAAILTLPGVKSVVKLDHGIGVIADTFEQCLKAKKVLDIQWSTGNKADKYESTQAFEAYQKIATNEAKGEIILEQGEVAARLAGSTKVYEAFYKNDFVYHAQMEPLNAVVSVAEDGKSAEAWVGSQAPDGARRAIAQTLGIEFADVTLHPCYLGGGFGRRSMADYVEEATELSNAIKKPIKLIWTREDDVQYGAFRPVCLQRMVATLDDDGYITSWNHNIVGTGDGLLASGAKNPYYSIEHQYIDLRNVDEGVRTKHWRSVGHGPNKYAIEAFIDEVARDQGKDPYQYRRHLLRNNPRELKVLDTAAKMCEWGKTLSAGRARGMAFAERSGALVAGVAEISVDKDLGKIKVHHFWCAMDAGVVVQPDNAVAQLEGGIIFGLGSVLHESITFKNGQVEQSNFHNYHIARMMDIPDSIDIEIIPSEDGVAGVGEASTPVVGGAIANAFLALTGKAIRHMPFTAERVKAILEPEYGIKP
jgi:isoquinoline 1-oxidoreductase beta subunit